MIRFPALALPALAALAATSPLPSWAEPPYPVRPDAVILLDMTREGHELVAVGERGTILRTGDGHTWSAAPTPTPHTLSAVTFSPEGTGIAVGHGGTLLRSTDQGRSWSPVTVAEAGHEALLGVTALGGGRFIAHGAFGLILVSEDNGRSWARQRILGSDFDRHIYRIIARRPNDLLLVGESGTLAESADGGQSWQASPSPYEGSFFGALALPDGAALIFGMRGHVFRSNAPGAEWIAIPTGTIAAFNNGTLLEDGRIVLVGNNGIAAFSDDGGRSFRSVKAAQGANLAQTAELNPGVLVAAGDTGILSITEPPRGGKDPRHE